MNIWMNGEGEVDERRMQNNNHSNTVFGRGDGDMILSALKEAGRREQVTWSFTPSKPVRLYQGEGASKIESDNK